MKLVFLNGQYRPNLSFFSDPSYLGIVEYVNNTSPVLTLRIPENYCSDQPIHLQHLNTMTVDSTSPQPLLIHLRIPSESKVILFDSYDGDPDLEYTNTVEITLEAAENACLHYYKWQNESCRATHQAKCFIKQEAGSYVATYHAVSNGEKSINEFHYLLEGERAGCESLGFYHTKKNQTVAVHSCIQHTASYTRSRQFYKGIADHRSHALFEGRVVVNSGLKDITAHQTNNNLLLSEQAKVETRPQLEIYAEDVSCSHGATVGQLDESALFYLQSRGLAQQQASNVLMQGFSNEIFTLFPHRAIAHHIQEQLASQQLGESA